MTPDPVGTPELPPDISAFYVEYEEERSRLTTFFRIFTALPHMLFLMLYGIAAFVATVVAWFAIVFTARYPQGLYDFNEGYMRYLARVYSYAFLATDSFPPFSGNPDEPYNAHFQIGPAKETYSRWKTFFRSILIIPFYVVAYVFTLIFELASFIAWFVIVITGKQPKGLQDALIFGMSYVIRLNTYYNLQTEAWPTLFTDDRVAEALAAEGYGPWPPTVGTTPAVAAPVPPAEPGV